MPNLSRGLPAFAAALAAAPLLTVAVGDLAPSAAGTTPRAGGYRILLVSNRDGEPHGYSVRPNGSRLTPLLHRRLRVLPEAVSPDGRTIAYEDTKYAIYVSRADGTGLRRLVRGPAFDPTPSPDGKLLAFRTGEDGFTLSIVGADGRGRRRLTTGPDDLEPDWSPDGKAIVFDSRVGEDVETLVVQPLHGRRRVLARVGFIVGPAWSPDGRWIAYLGERGLYLVRPNGSSLHRVAPHAAAFSWSPDGKRLAYVVHSGEDVAVVGVDGRGRRLRLRDVGFLQTLKWSPDGRRLALGGSDGQIRIVDRDGHGLRRVTSRGRNGLVGWTRLAPVLPRAAPIPPTERVTGARSLALRGPAVDLAADGSRVALVVGTTPVDCHHVAVWTPAARTVRRFDLPAPCQYPTPAEAVALAGTRVAWQTTSGGLTLETSLITATLERPTPVPVAVSARADTGSGTVVGKPVGDGTLLSFVVERGCDSSDGASPENACPPGRHGIVAATLYLLARPGPCPVAPAHLPRTCTAIAEADGTLSVLAADAGRIVLRTDSSVRLLSVAGDVLRDFAVPASAAALSGNRLAVRTAEAVEVYEVDSGRLAVRLPAPGGLRLEDLDRDVLVTAAGGTVTLRRLGDGRTATIRAGGSARAQLEPPGLYVAGAGRLTFTPMRDVLRLLGG